MIFDRLADCITNHAKAIIAIWVVILVCSVPLALKSGEVMIFDTTSMAGDDSESIKGMEVMVTQFPTAQSESSDMPIIVVKYDDAEEKLMADTFVTILGDSIGLYQEDGQNKLAAIHPMSPQSKDDGTGIIMIALEYDANVVPHDEQLDDTPELRSFINSVVSTNDIVGIEVYLTGNLAISYDMSTGAAEDIARIDPFTVLLILILVGLFFRSFVTSATPPITIGFAFVVVLAAIFFIGHMIDIYFITEMMLLVSMMGAGCDYCIFIISRYREELRNGLDHEKALHQAVVWAGESISISGATVIIGFGAMCICSFAMVSTMGVCLALGILIALLAALTLIPSILAIVGDRIFWPTKIDAYKEGGKATRGWFAACGRFGKRYFEASSRFSLKHAKAIVLVSVLVTVPAVYVMNSNESSYDMISAMQTGDSGEGMELIGEYSNQGIFMPNYVLIQYDEDIATISSDPILGLPRLVWADGFLSGLNPMYNDIRQDDNVAEISGPFSWAAAYESVRDVPGIQKKLDALITNSPVMIQTVLTQVIDSMQKEGFNANLLMSEYLQPVLAPVMDYMINVYGGIVGGSFSTGGTGMGGVQYINVSVSTKEAAMAPVSMDTISFVEGAVDTYAAGNPAVVQTWLTGTPAVMFEVSEVIGSEFEMIEVIVILLIIVLLFVVMRSYTIPFRSVLTVLMSICWTLAITSLVFVNLLGGEILWLVPLILLVICLGLGMDYDILLTTRIKENVMARGMSNDEAIHQAVTHTGSVITICGLIMGGAFGTLMLSSMTMLQQFGFTLCFAILIDALVVRTYIVPAVMHLLGDWNWKGPGRKVRASVRSESEEKP